MKFTAYLTIALTLAFLIVFSVSCNEKEDAEPIPNMGIKVPTEGNSWFFLFPGTDNQQVMNPGSMTWTDPRMVHRTYFRIERSGDLHVGIRVKTENGVSVLLTDFMGEEKEFEVSTNDYEEMYIGTYVIDQPGYYYLDIQGVTKESLNFAEISDVLLGGSATQGGVHYVFEEYFYWGRRGPSVHLTYEVPSQASSVRYFYNEVTVPEGNDVIGSFYMANGFSQGYFGFQVNSETERRILFSVWSPYVTDNPSDIPPEMRVLLLRKGDNVVSNDFGGEGSGGQSYLVYNWEAGKTYRFLLKGEPAQDEENKTDFTAWFSSEYDEEWKLIAGWRRPVTSTYLTGIHSFLENFVTRTGPLQRKAFYNHQWVRDTSDNWYELNRARFTADATARDKARLDYAGGYYGSSEGFFMMNCGFFNETTNLDIWFDRLYLGQQPEIVFESLP